MQHILASNLPKNKELIATALENYVVVLPTETSYGLSCSIYKKDLVEEIEQIKQREKSKSFLVLVKDKTMASEIVEMNDEAKAILRAFPNDGLSVILKKKDSCPTYLGMNKTLAIRISNYPVINELFNAIDFPLISTSLNESGLEPIYKISKAKNFAELKQIKMLVDAGDLEENPNSTIVDLTAEEPKIVRTGKITLEQIKKAIQNAN
ncbi:MAG: L-threonylcarbamoyladenylate synthase [bacterium]